MPTPAERRALLFVASIAVLGAGWRSVRATTVAPPTDTERSALAAQIAAVDSARAAPVRRGAGRGGRSGRGRGSAPARTASTASLTAGPEVVDVDRASAEELEGLPRIGPMLARRIVADRDSLGPFGSLDALQRVKGVGPAMARELASRVTFSAPARSPPAAGTTAPVRGQIVWRSARPP